MHTKPKKCQVCRVEFIPARMGQKVCSAPCAITRARAAGEKKRKRDLKDRKEALKTISDYRREAQTAFNAYIRERDRNKGCISCGTHTAGQYHAGHYRTRAAAPQLAFNCLNVWLQCAQCNNYMSGRIADYRIELVRRIGSDRVEAIENNNDLAGYTREHLIRLKEIFKRRTKHIKRLRERIASKGGGEGRY